MALNFSTFCLHLHSADIAYIMPVFLIFKLHFAFDSGVCMMHIDSARVEATG